MSTPVVTAKRDRSLVTLYDEDWSQYAPGGNRYGHQLEPDHLPEDVGVICYGIRYGHASRKGPRPTCECCGHELDRPSYIGKYELVNSKSGRCRNLAHWKLVDPEVEELKQDKGRGWYKGRGWWNKWSNILRGYNEPLGVPYEHHGDYDWCKWSPGDKQRQLTKKELHDWLLVHNLKQLGPK